VGWSCGRSGRLDGLALSLVRGMSFEADGSDTLLEGRELGYNQQVLGGRRIMLMASRIYRNFNLELQRL
jgi:hypothetical protein